MGYKIGKEIEKCMQVETLNDRLKCRMLLKYTDFRGILTYCRKLWRSPSEERSVLVNNSTDPSNLDVNASG